MLEELGVAGKARENSSARASFSYAFGEVFLKLYRFDWHSGDMRADACTTGSGVGNAPEAARGCGFCAGGRAAG